jgi:hypothetical protein
MEKPKDGTVEQLMPGANFASGSITLYEIIESKGKKIGQTQSPAEATISDRDKAILAKAIPADRFERVLKSVANKLEVGNVMFHKPTGKHVRIIKLNVGKSSHGAIQHSVKVLGTSIKCKVKGDNLCPL